ncbi:MAG: DEAD/DEAH box helicase [Proteobacteria bacterium]|nr:DEAD/DEAH box helicase [Pseudomonadota bacterium]
MINQEQETKKCAAPSSPEAESSFRDFNLCKEVAAAIEKLGFIEPTLVQARTYNEIMAGDDLITMAQTGTGKTAAFGIPIVEKVDPKKRQVQSLVLTPTRELALQVCNELTKIGEIRGVRCAAVYGGASFSKQISEVREGAQVIAGTPGRVLDHIRRGTISFSGLGILVLDEADEMLSMGFEKEISEIVESLPKQRQNLLFSATIPDDIRRLSKRYMGEATIISVSGDEIGAKEVSHFVYLVSGEGRPKDMVRVIEVERPESALIFCNTREETQTLSRYLKNAGYNADWLNSDLSQHEREVVMKRTRDGKIKFLVATDVAARGIDVTHLSHVINYSFPESLEIYIHRTGRTGRMGRHGMAISLITPRDIGNLYYLRLTYKIQPVEKKLEDNLSIERAVELNRLGDLRNALKHKSNDDFLKLAHRVTQDVHSARIISGLLANYFETQAKDVKVDKEPSKQPLPAKKKIKKEFSGELAKEPESTPRTESENKAVKKKAVDQENGKSKPKEAEKVEAKEDEIYVDAGRKDGLRISLLMKEIERLTNLPRSALGKVRLLTRSTFVAVSKEHFQTVLKAIEKVEIDGRKLKAEPARES